MFTSAPGSRIRRRTARSRTSYSTGTTHRIGREKDREIFRHNRLSADVHRLTAGCARNVVTRVCALLFDFAAEGRGGGDPREENDYLGIVVALAATHDSSLKLPVSLGRDRRGCARAARKFHLVPSLGPLLISVARVLFSSAFLSSPSKVGIYP